MARVRCENRPADAAELTEALGKLIIKNDNKSASDRVVANAARVARKITHTAAPKGARRSTPMAFIPKLKSCGLFENKRNDRSDLDGAIQIECPKCHQTSNWWVNGWRKVSQGGLNYISIALKPKGDSQPTKQDEEF